MAPRRRSVVPTIVIVLLLGLWRYSAQPVRQQQPAGRLKRERYHDAEPDVFSHVEYEDLGDRHKLAAMQGQGTSTNSPHTSMKPDKLPAHPLPTEPPSSIETSATPGANYAKERDAWDPTKPLTWKAKSIYLPISDDSKEAFLKHNDKAVGIPL